MDSRRAHTIEALASFIAKQKALLARTQSDIKALCRLRSEAVADATGLSAQLGDSAFRLSQQVDCAPAPPDIDWALFAHKDPTPLRALALPRPRPPPLPPAAPSDLQQLVRAARARILDPVLVVYGEPEPPPPEALTSPTQHTKTLHATANGNGKDECAGPRMPPRGPSGLFTRRPRVRVDVDPSASADPNADAGSTTAIDSASTRGTRTASPRCPSPPSAVEIPMAMESEEIPMALAKPVRARRISTKLQHQNSDRGAPLVTRARRKSGAAAPVGAGAGATNSTNASVGTRTSARAQGRQVPVATPEAIRAAAAAPPPAPKQQRLKLILPARSAPAPASVAPSRPANLRAKEHTNAPSPASPAPASFSASPTTFPAPSPADSQKHTEVNSEPANEDAPRTVLGKRRRASAAATKLDTYKVMWSASEQNLLERLLDEIPAGDARRYQKISIAMGGRRTPRQVSSRVQKYLQKLKKFGVDG